MQRVRYSMNAAALVLIGGLLSLLYILIARLLTGKSLMFAVPTTVEDFAKVYFGICVCAFSALAAGHWLKAASLKTFPTPDSVEYPTTSSDRAISNALAAAFASFAAISQTLLFLVDLLNSPARP